MFGLDAERVVSHGHQAVAADRENQVHALTFVEVLAQRRPRGVRDAGLFIEFVHGVEHQLVQRGSGLAELDIRDLVVGQPLGLGDESVVGPLVFAMPAVRDPQDRELAEPGVERRAEQQVVAEPQERLGQVRVAGQRRQCGAGTFRVEPLLGEHDRECVSHVVVPLVGWQRGHAHVPASSP